MIYKWRVFVFAIGLTFILVSGAIAQDTLEDCNLLYQNGMTSFHQFDFQNALNQFQQASVCYQKIDNHEGEGVSLNNIGFIYSSLGQYEEALDYLQQSLDIIREIDDKEEEGRTLSNIGYAYRNLSQYEEALNYYQQSLSIRREIGDREGEAESLNNIGRVYDSIGMYEQALDYYKQSLSIDQEIGDRPGEGTSLSNIGSIYLELGQYKQALDNFEQSLVIFQENGDRSAEGAILNNIGAIYDDLEEYEQALDYYQQSLRIHQAIGDRSGEGTTLGNIGSIYAKLGNNEQAEDYFEQSLSIFREIGDQAGEGTTLSNIGFIYDSLGEKKKALDYYRQSLSIDKEIGNRPQEGITLNTIGLIYIHLGQYEEALNYFQRSLTIRQEIGDRPGEGVMLNNIGAIYSRLGQYEQALDYYQQSLTVRMEINDQGGEGESLNNIGFVYFNMDKNEQALDYYQQSLVIRQEIGDQAGEGVTSNNIGLIYVNWGQHEEALNYFTKSLSIFQQMGVQVEEAHVLNNIGAIYDDLEEYEQALDYYQRSLRIVENLGERSIEVKGLNNVGSLYAELGQYEKALDNFEKAMESLEDIRAQAGSEQGRASFVTQYIPVYHQTVDLLHQLDRGNQAFLITERSRARSFLDSLATGQVHLSDNEAASLFTQEQEWYTRRQSIGFDLAEARAVNPPNPDRVTALEQQLSKAETAYTEVQTKIQIRNDQLVELIPGRSKNVLGVLQIQTLLDRQTTLISYYVLEDKMLVFLITHDSFYVVPIDVSQKELAYQIQIFRDFATFDDAYPDSLVTLYDWLITPLKDRLTTPHLVIIPHQVLHYLPFAALTDGKHYLIDDYTLTILPSASSLPFVQKNAKQTAYTGDPIPLILGNPATGDYDATASLVVDQRQYHDQLGSLPFAEKEAQEIADLFGVKPLIGQAATESAVREQVSHVNILHLAAHGTFNPVAPLNSLIALAPDNPKPKGENTQSGDGWLTVGEVYGLDLKKTDLVVLSACETNLGDLSEGDELVGLTRAFIFAGTPSVIASLWNVDDQATAFFMERFYTHLKDGVSKAEALRQAQLEVREIHPNPYFWSAFVLSGESKEKESRSSYK